ncbi:MAG: peptidase M48 Ste24p [Gammaproteobacteria bacterium]|nr:MAG: peptidase M48 Ste24p [Gammaproteobacteria bacterium]TND04438.1 MAG: peptidase M48 Ste24p [Gammaproteobacteria bacterium]
MLTRISTLGLLLGALCVTGAVCAGQAFRDRIHSDALTVTTGDDIKAEISFGQNVAARVLGRFKIHDDAALNRYINLVGTALAANSGRGELTFHFAVLESDSVNAYSTPGGYIFITHGALALMEDEAELAAVLAHEIAHVSERHIVNALNIRATDNSVGGGFSRLIGAGNSTTQVAFTQVVDQAVEILFTKGYQQQDELDADRVATLLLSTAGYDPLALRRYLERAQAIDDENSRAMNATHPPSRQRLRSIDQLVKEEGMDSARLARIKTRFDQHVSHRE